MIERILELLRAVLDEVHTLVQDVELKTTDRQHVLSGALLGRVLEFAEGIYVMLERRDSACSLILLRSLLEVHVDLRNLAEDPGYDEFMHAAWLNQQRRGLQKALKKGSDSRLIATSDDADEAREHLDHVHSTLQELKSRDIIPLSIESRFQRAGELDLYDGPYAHLSWNTHSNLNVLEERHVRVSDAGFEIQAFAPICNHEAAIVSDTTAGVAANALVAVRKLAHPDAGQNELNRLGERLESLRKVLRSEVEGESAPNQAAGAGG